MAFDIASVLKAAPEGRDEIVYLDLDLLDPDPDNFYSLDGLDELAGNIELIGLQQPLRVRRGEPGRYIIVSGHRRRAACMMIRNGGSAQFDGGVPCIIERGEDSPAMRELRLIYANASTRVMSAAEISKQAERVEALLYQLKEEGTEFPGRMRDHVAEACRVSKSKLARLHAIRKNLDPGLLERFDRGEMQEETAYQLSRLPKQAQAGVETCLLTGRKKQMPYAYQVEHVVRMLDTYTKPAPCHAHAGAPDCTITNVHICRSVWEPYRDCWNLTSNEEGEAICCRECNDRDSCSWACQECKARRKLDKAVEKEKAEERARAEERERKQKQDAFRWQRRRQAKRLLPLIEAAGLDDDDEMPPKFSCIPGIKVERVREAAAGDFGDATFYDSSWSLVPDGSNLKAWAKKLNCSTDFLLDLTDDPKPRAAWSTGTPTEIGEYLIRCGVPAEEKPGSTIKSIKTWTGTEWASSEGVPLRLNVYGWILIPEV